MREITLASNILNIISFFMMFDINTSKGIGRNGLLKSRLPDPVILLLDSKEQGLSLRDLLNSLTGTPVNHRGFKHRTSNDEKAFSLYDFLRQSQTQIGELGNVNVDANSDDPDKFFHHALRMRCGSLDRCVDKCPKKEKYTCQISCQQVIDEDNMCDEPPKMDCNPRQQNNNCGGSYGKTFPPRWRKNLLRAKKGNI